MNIQDTLIMASAAELNGLVSQLHSLEVFRYLSDNPGCTLEELGGLVDLNLQRVVLALDLLVNFDVLSKNMEGEYCFNRYTQNYLDFLVSLNQFPADITLSQIALLCNMFLKQRSQFHSFKTQLSLLAFLPLLLALLIVFLCNKY